MNPDEYRQQELEIQERIENDPEYRREYEEWLDSKTRWEEDMEDSSDDSGTT